MVPAGIAFFAASPEFSRPPYSSCSWSMMSVGTRAVAGAELTSLTPSLARYFDVDGGVLITAVTERSQAADSGLEAGDVVVAVNGEAVETIAALRTAILRLQRSPVTVGMVRQRGSTPEPVIVRGDAVIVRGTDRRDDEPEPIVLGIIREGRSMEIEPSRWPHASARGMLWPVNTEPPCSTDRPPG